MKTKIDKNKNKSIYLDMDGTICNLYKDPNWLDRIIAEDTSLFKDAEPLINIDQLTKIVKRLQNRGYKIGIISYLPWKTSKKYQLEIKKIKEEYLKTKFSKITFDKIHIIPYGIPKDTFANDGDCLFDDDKKIRSNWNKGKAYTHEDLINKLKRIYKI